MERCCTLLETQALNWVRMTYRVVPRLYQIGECPKVNAPRAGAVRAVGNVPQLCHSASRKRSYTLKSLGVWPS